MLNTLFDPKVFNYIIMSLYLMASVRWGIAHKWGDMCYWFFACGITATVTFLYKH